MNNINALTSYRPYGSACCAIGKKSTIRIVPALVHGLAPSTGQERLFVVQLPSSSRLELQPPYQSLVAYWSKQEEEAAAAAAAGEQAEGRENSAERPLIRRRLRDF